MRKIAILIAVEHYLSEHIPQVKYAQADADELSAVLLEHSLDPADQTALINEKATKASIESRVRTILADTNDDDMLYVYYAGHGFARDARNFITCYDTDVDDLEHTSIPIEWLFGQFTESACNKITMFLDSCESGMLASASIRGIYTDLREEELDKFFKHAEHCVCFAACKPGQSSYSSDKLKHGIWTYHLLEALRAKVPTALEKGQLLTSSSLQNYLAREVPRTLRNTRTGTVVQTPWSYGASSGDFLIADMGLILDRREREANPSLQQLKRVVLYRERMDAIKHLSGFKKRFHHVPDCASSAADSFVAKIAAQELSDDLDQKYEALRATYGLKRRDIAVGGPDDGAGTIITPFFDYEVTVQVNPDNLSEALWRHQVVNIRVPEKVFCDEFDVVFADDFDTLEFEVTKRMDIEELVDQIENIGDDYVQVDYDRNCTFCRLSIDRLNGFIVVTPTAFRYECQMAGSVQTLVEGFFTAQKLLVDRHKVRQLPFLKSDD